LILNEDDKANNGKYFSNLKLIILYFLKKMDTLFDGDIIFVSANLPHELKKAVGPFFKKSTGFSPKAYREEALA